MSSDSLKKDIGFFRILLMSFLFICVISILIQMKFPTIEGLQQKLTLSLFEGQMEMDKPGPDLLLKKGWVYYNQGRYQEARQSMEQSFKSDYNISALYCLGLIDLKARKFDDGIKKLEAVLEDSPRHVPTIMVLAETYYQQGYFIRAKKLFERAVIADPTNNQARLGLGKTCLVLKEAEEAREVLDTVSSGEEAGEAAALLKNLN